MFLNPQIWQKGEPVSLSKNAKIKGEGYALDLINETINQFGIPNGSIQNIEFWDTLPEGFALKQKEDCYAVKITADKISLYGTTLRGRIYAAVTLKQLCEFEELTIGYIEDAPYCDYRGYRAFLPGHETIEDFYKMVDMLVYYKHNFLFLEVGGAMEYKRHPKINEVWVKYAEDTKRFSGRTHEIQYGYPWRKNSIHTDNGEGDVLTQEEVRGLIEYCRYRGLSVCPEVPTLSHADYICMAYPHIREREEDIDFPDTYCPNHPDTYKIVFDILEEIINVFEPKIVNIGHDEVYTLCLCPRCKDKKPFEVFSDDVVKIHDWLSERGIRTAMWGDQLLAAILPDGRPWAGSGSGHLFEKDDPMYFNPTFYCRHILPKDILMLNWYHSYGQQYDYVYHDYEFETIYGNCSAHNIKHWGERIKAGTKGGLSSNWGTFKEEYMQRNLQYFRFASNAYAYWNENYGDDEHDEMVEKTFAELFRFKYGKLENKPYIVISHNVNKFIAPVAFYDGLFIENSVYHLGYYEVKYSDNTTAKLDVKYGTNIASKDINYDYALKGIIIYNDDGTPTSSGLAQVSYSTLPFINGGETWYKTAYINPYPEKEIVSVEYKAETDDTVNVLEITY